MINKINITIAMLAILLGLGFADWQSLNGPPAGRADDMSMGWDPELYYWVIYAADQTHKLYKSTNEGEYWDSITYFDITKNPTCVITRPNDAQVVFIGKNNVTPVWWSIDGGANWEERSGTPPNNITNTMPHCFCMDPNDPEIVYLGCMYSGITSEMFKTAGGGVNWSALTDAPNADVNEVTAVGSTKIFASCGGSADKGIWLSTDGGDHWTPKLAGINIYSIDFADELIGYAGSSASYGIYKSADGGDNWIRLENSPQEQINDLKAITTNTVYVATNGGMFKTTDGGANWTEINEGICARYMQALTVHPANSQILFAGGPICVYKSTDGGISWQEIIYGFKFSKLKSLSNKSSK